MTDEEALQAVARGEQLPQEITRDWSYFFCFWGRLRGVHAHAGSGRYLETSAVTVTGSSARTLSSHMLLPRHPILPVLRNSRGVDIRLDRSRGRSQFLRAANRRSRAHAGPLA